MNDNDRALCATTASLLQAAGGIASLGLAMSGIALGVLALTARSLSLTSCMGFGAVAIIGVFERYLALRLRLDVGLFEGLARGSIASLPALDTALSRIGMRQSPDAARSLADRVLGTRQLVQRHGITVACQAAMFLLGLLTQDLQ
ncbi:hypothetical protein WKW80_18290 [Variovorax humicola]|uniref:Uncharacterized protein n=1 Tax=Variovorax humicola TaxID=1769758 RepID=A0ABU8W1N3_9BURK